MKISLPLHIGMVSICLLGIILVAFWQHWPVSSVLTCIGALFFCAIAYWPRSQQILEIGSLSTRQYQLDPAMLALHRQRMAQTLSRLEVDRELQRSVFEVSVELVRCHTMDDACRYFAAALRSYWRIADIELLVWEQGRWMRLDQTNTNADDKELEDPPQLTRPVELPSATQNDLLIDLSPAVSGQAMIIARRARLQPGLEHLSADAQRYLAEVLRSQLALALRRIILHKDLQSLGRTDPLTGTWRRWYGERRLDELVENGNIVAVAMIDLDFFKQVNDRFGHAAGDTTLQALGKCLADSIRQGDLVYRYGGEEFVLILPDTSPIGAEQVAERIRSAVSSLADLPTAITVSIGVACCHRDETAQELLARADAAMYQAKAAGRDRVINADNNYDSPDIRKTHRLVRRDDTTGQILR